MISSSPPQRTGITNTALARLIGPASWMIQVSEGRYEAPPHIQYLEKVLLEAIGGKHEFIMVTLPPRHGKSSFISEHFTAWFIGMFPNKRVIFTSYAADFAAQWGRKSRELIDNYGYTFPIPISVDPASSAADRWNVVNRDDPKIKYAGGMQTAGAGGPITGKGGDLIIIDDPIKNDSEALSARLRERLVDWYKATLYTRREPGAIVILIMTRWHKGDLAGYLQKEMAEEGDRWTIIDFPAIAEENDILGREKGEALWPKRFPISSLLKIKRAIGKYWFSALYQQTPIALESGMFKRENIEVLRNIPIPQGVFLRTWDTASTAKGKTSSDPDYLVGLKVVFHQGFMYIVGMFRDRIDPQDVEPAMRNIGSQDGPGVTQYVLREPGSQAKVYCQTTLKTNVFPNSPYLEAQAGGSKQLMAMPVSTAIAERHEVKIIINPEFTDADMDALLSELEDFPFGAHDDIVDCLAAGYNLYAQPQDAEETTVYIDDEDERMISSY